MLLMERARNKRLSRVSLERAGSTPCPMSHTQHCICGSYWVTTNRKHTWSRVAHAILHMWILFGDYE
jgi:hypothetical protein